MSAAAARGEDPVIDREARQRVHTVATQLQSLATHVERGRREDLNLIGDKIERWAERMAHDAATRDERIHQRLDRIEEVQSEMREEQKDICDKGQQEHAAMQRVSAALGRQIQAVQKHLSVKAAKEEGRRQILGWLFVGVEKVTDNWGKFAIGAAAAAALLKSFWPPVPEASALPVAVVTEQQGSRGPYAVVEIPEPLGPADLRGTQD